MKTRRKAGICPRISKETITEELVSKKKPWGYRNERNQRIYWQIRIFLQLEVKLIFMVLPSDWLVGGVRALKPLEFQRLPCHDHRQG